MTRLRHTFAPAAMMITALLLGGCAASVSESGSDSGGGWGGEPAPGMPAPAMPDGDWRDDDGGGDEDSPAVDPSLGDGRQVVTTGWMYLTVEAPLEAATEAARITERAGGRVDGRTEYAPRGSDAGGAELVLRIPSASLQDAIDDLKELGQLEELSLTASDVTREVQDLDARIGALESSLERLLALLVQADDVDDLIMLESVIADRQGQLESMQAQRRSLGERVALSTLTLTLGSEAVAPPSELGTFGDGLAQGWEALVAFGSAALVLAGIVLPWLAVVGVLGLIVWVSVRVARRQRAGRAPHGEDAPTPAP
jgi:hypothetical protein